MDEKYYADRVALKHLLQQHGDWTAERLAETLGRSESWVKKWRLRIRAAESGDESVLNGWSRVPRRKPASIAQEVVDQILDWRDNPPRNLRRVPGPKALKYYLQDSPLGYLYAVPRSTSTLWRILKAQGRIAEKRRVEHHPVERAAPMQHWQLDFKDVSSVPADANGEGKQQHVVESLNVVDVGTSRVVSGQLSSDYTAETVLHAVAEVVRQQGLPQVVTFDRDPRFVGAWSGKDFPSPWVRFWQCLGVQVDVCPPHHPEKNAFVERYHRAYQEECLAVERPRTLAAAQQATRTFIRHYNTERPNQAISCQNRPPDVAFPRRPTLPSVPDTVALDGWLSAIHGKTFTRRLNANGQFTLGEQRYYVKRTQAHQFVSITVDAHQQQLTVRFRGAVLRTLPLKGLQCRSVAFDTFVDLLSQQAQNASRRLFFKQRASSMS